MNPSNTRMFRPVFALLAIVGLSACASVDRVDETVFLDPASRAAPVQSTLTPAVSNVAPVSAAIEPNFKVNAVNVTVPTTLRVSEANRYLPAGDIVWREDPIGNRYEQVGAIVAAGLKKGVADMDGDRQVEIDVVVQKFHALTEKARYTIGGVHAIQFTMRIRDAQTGETLVEPKFINADFDALGGQAAIQAEARGITQKVRITNHLAYVIQQELLSNEGYIVHDTGFIGALNQI